MRLFLHTTDETETSVWFSRRRAPGCRRPRWARPGAGAARRRTPPAARPGRSPRGSGGPPAGPAPGCWPSGRCCRVVWFSLGRHSWHSLRPDKGDVGAGSAPRLGQLLRLGLQQRHAVRRARQLRLKAHQLVLG